MKLNSLTSRSSLLLTAFASFALSFAAFSAQAQSKSDSAAATSPATAATSTASAAQAPGAQSPAVPARITQAIDETQLVRLRGNVHPLARPEFDQGAVPDSTPAKRMLLLLQRSASQEATLGQLLEDQQNAQSPNFHKWLTPDLYGKQFGPADADVQVMTDWLTSQGFQGIKVSAGRTAIEFSGNIGQVRTAFHTDIHQFKVNGEVRHANVNDPQIPAALTPVVAGIAGLHNFPPRAHVHKLGTFRKDKATGAVKPLFTYPQGAGFILAVGPTDFATIYNVLPLWNAATPIDGTGQTIALVGDSNINLQDVTAFRTMFGLPTSNAFNTPNVILNGPDPGLNGDEIEADLDVQWAGAIAKNAQIILVVTEQPQSIGVGGVDLSAFYIVDNNLAPIMSESFGNCEAFANNTLENSIWQQASAQGITAMVSAGDNGSAACDPSSTNPLVATQGLAVSGFASTPYNVAVGGTDFNSNVTGSVSTYLSTYWNTTNAASTQSSAKSYIPEITWNDTCAYQGSTSACTSTVITNDANSFGPGIDVVAGSGGSSAVYTGSKKPSWQAGLGDANRDLPDISLLAANGRNGSFYIICEMDANAGQGGSPTSCDLNSPYLDFIGLGGTSASSPTFAGIMALVNQKTGQRQGNANYALYSMAKKTGATCPSNPATAAAPGSCIFYDLPAGSGNISVACQGGSPQCSNTSTATTSFGIMTTTSGGATPAYNTAAGYDLATGLGTVNAANLVNNWTNPSFTPSKLTFSLNGGAAVTITHGAAVSVSGTVSPNPGSGTPTGTVELIQGTNSQTGAVIDSFPVGAGGAYSGNTLMLPGTNGTSYQVIAHYSGDGAFSPSDSPSQTVTSVAKETSITTSTLEGCTTASIPCTTPIPSGSSIVYGSAYILRVDVTNASGQQCSSVAVPCPTGNVMLTDGTAALDFGTGPLNNIGMLEDQPIQLPGGSHSIVAKYLGDVSYTGSTASAINFTVTPTATATAMGVSPSSGVTSATPVTLSAQIASSSNSSVGPTGSVTFLNGATQVATAAVTGAGASLTGASGTASTTLTLAAGTYNLTAKYVGDTNYATSTSTPAITLTVTAATTGTFSLTGTAIPAVTAGSSATSTITVTPTAGSTLPPGTVNVSCTTANLPPGVSCTPSPLAITDNSTTSAASAPLTVTVTGPSAAMATASLFPENGELYAAGIIASPSRNGKGWWGLSASTGVGALVLLFLPGRKRYRAALGLGLVCILSFTLGCGSYGGGGGGGGPVATVTHITVTSPTKAGQNTTFTFTATVTGGTPADQVELLDNGVVTGLPVTVSGGTAMLTTSALSVVGTHSISAQYLGDATYTLPSTSGTLFVTVTGTTNFAISSNPAPSAAPAPINITIN